jgi:hypothetical protein
MDNIIYQEEMNYETDSTSNYIEVKRLSFLEKFIYGIEEFSNYACDGKYKTIALLGDREVIVKSNDWICDVRLLMYEDSESEKQCHFIYLFSDKDHLRSDWSVWEVPIKYDLDIEQYYFGFVTELSIICAENGKCFEYSGEYITDRYNNYRLIEFD